MLPTTTAGQQGPVGAWVSTAGWATAIRRVVGDIWIVTPAGLMGVDDVRRRAAHPQLASAPTSFVAAPSARRREDGGEGRYANFAAHRRFTSRPMARGREHDVRFVWQRHELFHTAGVELAAALGVPSVLFVPAPLMWQARQWGVRRPGWSRLLEQFGEARVLGRADLVACGSELVAEQVVASASPRSASSSCARVSIRTSSTPAPTGPPFVAGWVSAASSSWGGSAASASSTASANSSTR